MGRWSHIDWDSVSHQDRAAFGMILQFESAALTFWFWPFLVRTIVVKTIHCQNFCFAIVHSLICLGCFTFWVLKFILTTTEIALAILIHMVKNGHCEIALIHSIDQSFPCSNFCTVFTRSFGDFHCFKSKWAVINSHLFSIVGNSIWNQPWCGKLFPSKIGTVPPLFVPCDQLRVGFGQDLNNSCLFVICFHVVVLTLTIWFVEDCTFGWSFSKCPQCLSFQSWMHLPINVWQVRLSLHWFCQSQMQHLVWERSIWKLEGQQVLAHAGAQNALSGNLKLCGQHKRKELMPFHLSIVGAHWVGLLMQSKQNQKLKGVTQTASVIIHRLQRCLPRPPRKAVATRCRSLGQSACAVQFLSHGCTAESPVHRPA